MASMEGHYDRAAPSSTSIQQHPPPKTYLPRDLLQIHRYSYRCQLQDIYIEAQRRDGGNGPQGSWEGLWCWAYVKGCRAHRDIMLNLSHCLGALSPLGHSGVNAGSKEEDSCQPSLSRPAGGLTSVSPRGNFESWVWLN